MSEKVNCAPPNTDIGVSTPLLDVKEKSVAKAVVAPALLLMLSVHDTVLSARKGEGYVQLS